MTLDAVGAWPPIAESHVEMDGAWALYEAWVKIQTGEVDSALVYAYGKSSPGDLRRGADAASSTRTTLGAALARLGVAGRAAGARAARRRHGHRGQMAEVAAAQPARRAGQPVRPAVAATPTPRRCSTSAVPRRAAARARLPADLRRRRRRGPRRRRRGARAVRAAGVDPRHRPPHRAALRSGVRDLTDVAVDRGSPAEKAGVGDGPVDVAELHAPFTHQELILREALGLGDDVDDQPVGRRARAPTR